MRTWGKGVRLATIALALTGIGACLALAYLTAWLPFGREYTDGQALIPARSEFFERVVVHGDPEPAFVDLVAHRVPHSRIALAPGGRIAVYAAPGERERMDLFWAEHEDGRWLPRGPVLELNQPAADEIAPFFDAAGALYFASNRKGSRGFDLYVAAFDGRTFHDLYRLGDWINSPFDEVDPSYDARSGRLFFASNRPLFEWQEEGSDFDLYSAGIDALGRGAHGALRRIERLSSRRDERAPLMHPRSGRLFFASNRAGGRGGFDLYASTWSPRERAFLAPEPLGAAVNTAADESDLTFLEGGFTFYFRRGERGEATPAALLRVRSRELARLPGWLSAVDLMLLAAALALIALMAWLARRWQALDILYKALAISLLIHLAFLFFSRRVDIEQEIAAPEPPPSSGLLHVAFSPADDPTMRMRGGALEREASPELAPPERTAEPIPRESGRAPDPAPPGELAALVPEPFHARLPERAAGGPEQAAAAPAALEVALAPLAPPVREVGRAPQLEAGEPAAIEPPVQDPAEALTRPPAEGATASTAPAAAISPVPADELRPPARVAGARGAPARTPSQLQRAMRSDVDPRTPTLAQPALPPPSAAPSARANALVADLVDRVAGQRVKPAASPGKAALRRPAAAPPGEGAPGGATPAREERGAMQLAGPLRARAEVHRARRPRANLSPPEFAPGPVSPLRRAPAEEVSAPAAAGPPGQPVDLLAGLEAPGAMPPAEGVRAAGERRAQRPELRPDGIASKPLAGERAQRLVLAPTTRRGRAARARRPAGAPERGAVSAPPAPLVRGPRADGHPPDVGAGPAGDSARGDADLLAGLAPSGLVSLRSAPEKAARGSIRAGRMPLPALTPSAPGRAPTIERGAHPGRAPASGGRARGATPLAHAVKSIYSRRFGELKTRALKTGGGSAATERAVAAGLRYLASKQDRGGYWGSIRYRHEKYSYTIFGKTGLAILAFLGAGHVPGAGTRYAPAIQRAIDFLLANQDRHSGHFGDCTSYGHGIATYALCEAYAMSGSKRLRAPLQRAVDWIQTKQNLRRRGSREYGGWTYYYPDQRSFDSYCRASITAWQVMALESARMGGLEVTPQAFAAAKSFLAGCLDPRRGSFRYNHKPSRLRSAYPTLPGSTPAALFALRLLGEEVDHRLYAGAWRFTLERRPREYRYRGELPFVQQGTGNLYFWYYGTLAMFQRGGAEWERWNEALKAVLLSSQERDGSWRNISPYAETAGDSYSNRSYSTAMAVLMLEVYYRYFTPLLRRSEVRGG